MSQLGRATVTAQFEACDGRSVQQWYVMAEGPIRFTELDPQPHIKTILAKDRGEDNVDEWTAGETPQMCVSRCFNRSGFPATSSTSHSTVDTGRSEY